MSNKPNQEKNEFVLGSSMLPGEQILWQSETGKFGLMSGVYGRKVLTKWIVTIVVMLAIIGAYVMTVDPIKNSVVVMLLIVTALMLISPVMERNNLKGQRYILTNQRAILVRADRKIFTMPLSAIDDAQIVQLRRRVAELVRQVDSGMTIHDFRVVPGPSHTNLIFDAVLPFGEHITETEAAQQIRERVRQMDGGEYYAVVTVENPYV